MHLSNTAMLGWSPVLRSLMGRKRKKNRKVDEVEDGARARIVEEAIIKAIHAEGERLAALREPASNDGGVQLYPDGAEISFGFLKFIRSFVAGLESEKNRYWEWEAAILEGYKIFEQLRRHGEGTVTVDLTTQSLTYSHDVPMTLKAGTAA